MILESQRSMPDDKDNEIDDSSPCQTKESKIIKNNLSKLKLELESLDQPEIMVVDLSNIVEDN